MSTHLTTASGVHMLEVHVNGERLAIESCWVGSQNPAAPVIVFLHEGLGSLSLWKDFPDRLCRQLGIRGFVYSRPGYGKSTPRPAQTKWQPDFMHRQALDVLPAVLAAAGIDSASDCVWLFGHSDGGSIALIYAAHHPRQLNGLIVLAPHIMVEPISIQSIEQARLAYLNTDLKDKLARHHDDPDSAFWGWNDIWLNPAFRDWSIESLLPRIQCPVLAVQGLDDEYGTLAQIHGIDQAVPDTKLLELPNCGHSPHRDQPERLAQEVQSFFVHQTTSKET